MNDDHGNAIESANGADDPKLAERLTLVYLAQTAEKAQRYDEMVEWIKKVIELSPDLNLEERNILLAGYKNVIGARRASLRLLSSIERKEGPKSARQVELMAGYRQTIENELSNICKDIISIIDERLLPSASLPELTVFYHKMRADYYRYLAEFKTGQEKDDVIDQSLKSYETASEAAKAHLSATNPIRLGLALNYSVFYYEIMNATEKACHLAKRAFDDAAALLSTTDEELTQECTLVLQLLRENLTTWASYLPEGTIDLV